MFSGFSREYDYLRYWTPGASILSGSARRVDLPARLITYTFNGLFRQPAAVPLLRPASLRAAVTEY